MNPNNFFSPRYMPLNNFNPMIRMTNNIVGRPFGITSNFGNTIRNAGIFNKLTTGFRSFNWSSILNNANKTLNVVNQAIPLVRQTGPMINNMKSMFRIAKLFNSETNNNNNNNNNNNFDKYNKHYESDVLMQKKEVENSNYPNFFI